MRKLLRPTDHAVDLDGVALEADHAAKATEAADSAGPDDTGSVDEAATHDAAGNLVYDGLHKFYYDAWNRLAEVKRAVPEYTRIHRIQRDIPPKHVAGGLLTGNLRNIVQREMATHGWHCSCIRCREVGIAQSQRRYKTPPEEELRLEEDRYEACDGEKKAFQLALGIAINSLITNAGAPLPMFT